jgi:hypothetical protein
LPDPNQERDDRRRRPVQGERPRNRRRPCVPREADPFALLDRRSRRDTASGVTTPTPAPAVVEANEGAPSQPTTGRAGAVLLVGLAVLYALALVRFFDGAPALLTAGWRLPSIEQLGASLVAEARPLVDPKRAGTNAREGVSADRHLQRSGHASIHGGVLFFPSTFSSQTGAYDLLIHFHGNTRLVLESAEVAGVNALVALVNLGVGSAPYEEAYGVPGSYEALLEEIQRAALRRGLEGAHLRRVALSSWSAGYGAISMILDLRRGTDPLDAVLVTDGIHCGWVDDKHTTLNGRQLAPFVHAARSAAAGQILFSITHSEIDPISYASARSTAGFLLETVGVKPGVPDVLSLPHLALRAAEGAVAKKLEKHMEPIEEARAGSLHVRGFRGNTAEHHMAHLLQMGATVMPELAARWNR